MRVSGEGELPARRLEEGRRGDFATALERAEARRTERGRTESGRAATRVEERLALSRGVEGKDHALAGGGEVARTAGRAGSGAGSEGKRGEPAVSGAELPSAGGRAAGEVTGGAAAAPGGPSRAALTAAVRALPPVIEAFGAAGREVLVLDFGGAIGVELRRAPGGVEVGLAVPAALRPAARVELAGICQALAARGVTVVCAEVRGGVPSRGRR